MTERALEVARRVAAALAAEPEVVAVAVAGSVGAGAADAASDVDLYVYARKEPALEVRRAIVAGSPRAELDLRFFEPGDEWIDAATGLAVDVMYRSPAWIEDELARVVVRHEARVGYSTCFWANVLASRALFDRTGWYAALQDSVRVAYPAPLRAAIVAKNLPLLAGGISSYAAQLEKAVVRGDAVSANHRAAAFLASWFDVLFAVNGAPHPGEKRLLALAARLCPTRPMGMEEDVPALVRAAATLDPSTGARARALAAALAALV